MAISAKQLEANRRNSLLSTGPKTVEGKAESARNATSHGVYAETLLLEGEDAGALDELRSGYATQYAPQTAGERTLVDQIVSIAWRLKRLQAAESWCHRSVALWGKEKFDRFYRDASAKPGVSGPLPMGFTTHISVRHDYRDLERYNVIEQRLTNLLLRCTRDLRVMMKSRPDVERPVGATLASPSLPSNGADAPPAKSEAPTSVDQVFHGAGCQPVQEESSARAGSQCHEEDVEDASLKTQNEPISSATTGPDVISAGRARVVIPPPVLSNRAKALERAGAATYTPPDV